MLIVGIFHLSHFPTHQGEACPHCPFLEYSYTPIFPWTRTKAEFALGKKRVTCIFGIFLLPHA